MMNNLVVNIDYRYVLPEKVSDRTCIELMTGDFKGVIFSFNQIQMPEEKLAEETAEFVNIKFNFDVHEYKGFNLDELNENEDFHSQLGDILHNLIGEVVDRLEDEYDTRLD